VAALSERERERYARQLAMPRFDEEHQLALREASVLVVGAGGLGSAAAPYLAAAGVGRLGIADDDAVELSNLHRQVLYVSDDIGRAKAQTAAARLSALNPEIVVEPYPARVEAANAGAMVAGQDVVVDCTDRADTRYTINHACCEAGVTLVEAGALALSGVVMSVRPGRSACYRCAFPAPASGETGERGILGALAGAIGTLQALEAVKLITGIGEPLVDRFLELDGARSSFTEVATARRPDCPDCGEAVATL
jgi:molybdopterin/thiamine biosynthesis adenylyltransferase